MNIEQIETETEITFLLTDNLISHNANFLADAFTLFVKQDARDAIIDLTYVKKINSMSIAALIRLKNMLADKGRKMHLINPNETVFGMLELSGLDKFLLE